MRYFVIFLLGLFTSSIQAAVKVDIFKAEVVLDKGKADAENIAGAEGFKQVIIKASGDKRAIEDPVIKKALNNSGSYLSQAGRGTQKGQPTLQMAYNSSQIQSLLRQADLPYWPDMRANLIVWIIQEDQRGREILWEYSSSDVINHIKTLAAFRGLPVIIPVGDIEDVTGITEPDLWGGFVSPISAASQRYTSDAVVVIRIQTTGNSSVHWTLYDEKPQFMVNSKQRPITGKAEGEIEAALEKVIDSISNYYAGQSAMKVTTKQVTTKLDGGTTVRFSGIQSAKLFFELEKRLKTFDSVASAKAKKITGDSVTYRVELLSSEADFEAEVVRSSRFRKLEQSSEAVSNTPVDGAGAEKILTFEFN